MSKCLVNIIVGTTLDHDGNNLIENFNCDVSDAPIKGDSFSTKKYSGEVLKRVIDYSNIQYENPNHRGKIIIFLFCSPNLRKL
jgi:hypothetical protein